MEVVWTGAMERQAAEAERVYPAPSAPRPTITMVERVSEWLRTNSDVTAGEIASGLGAHPEAVNSALYQLRQSGELLVGELTTVRSTWGRRRLKTYRLREAC